MTTTNLRPATRLRHATGLRSARRVAAVSVAVLAFTACGGDSNGQSTTETVAPAFDANNAHTLLRRQVEFGPRVPGTAGHAAQLEWMVDYLRERADTVSVQRFDHEVTTGESIALANVFARFNPDNRERILLLAHWDTRPVADNEADSTARNQPILGANDGASGVAVLLQLADMFAANPPPIGVDILMTDGEDFATEPGDYGNMYLGATHFARNQPDGYPPLYGVLLDLVGDQTPLFPIEGHSQRFAPEVVDRVWRTAERLGYGHVFVPRVGMSITDDHVPLNEHGIRTIDIIDFDYGPNNSYWHTTQDVVENTSPEGLGIVGKVVAELVYSGG